MNDDLALERLARRLDSAAAAYYSDPGPGAALAYHAAKSALLAAVAREPGRRWWRGETCYEATPTGLLVWSDPREGPPPSRHGQPRNRVGFYTGPGVVPRAGKSLDPHRPRRDRRIPA